MRKYKEIYYCRMCNKHFAEPEVKTRVTIYDSHGPKAVEDRVTNCPYCGEDDITLSNLSCGDCKYESCDDACKICDDYDMFEPVPDCLTCNGRYNNKICEGCDDDLCHYVYKGED